MKNLSIILLFIFINANTKAEDSLQYSVKYKFIKQKDSSNSFSKFEDVMILTMTKKTSLYYSYLKQFGLRNSENDMNNNNDNNGNHEVKIDANSKDRSKYFILNETEVIQIDFAKKNKMVSDFLINKGYKYVENLDVPIWKIETITQNILEQKCQMATTSFRGRNYIAWFATGIPFSMGPWLFNGLPGLILKVHDDKKQFLFECMELNTQNSSTKVFKPYKNVQLIDAKKLKAKKKLLEQNIILFMQAEDGVSVTTDGGKPAVMKNKPYNPIDIYNK